MSTPTTISGATGAGAKMAFPGNVRIISVPSASSGAAAHRLVTATAGTTNQKNVYVLELSNDGPGKPVFLPSGETVQSALMAELNGTTVTPQVPPKTATPPPPTAPAPAKANEILSKKAAEVSIPAASEPSGHNGDYNRSVPGTQVTMEHGLLDPQTGIIYTGITTLIE